MTQFETLMVETVEKALVVRLNRPENRNAISMRMMAELVEVLTEANQLKGVSAVIITGNESVFSSGRDLKEAATSSNPSAAIAAWLRVTDSMEQCAKPVIAAIEGHCLTGGLELALACDLRVAGEGAQFGITSSRLGTLPGFGASQRLPRLIGASRALELLFMADVIGTAEAYRIGLINRQTEQGRALQECLSMARTLGERAPLSLAAMKKAVYGGIEMPLAEAIQWELPIAASLSQSRDRKEGMAAFAEKRKPNFTGE